MLAVLKKHIFFISSQRLICFVQILPVILLLWRLKWDQPVCHNCQKCSELYFRILKNGQNTITKRDISVLKTIWIFDDNFKRKSYIFTSQFIVIKFSKLKIILWFLIWVSHVFKSLPNKIKSALKENNYLLD